MNKTSGILLLSLFLSIAGLHDLRADDDALRIGVILPLSGMFELVGNNSRDAVELIKKDLDQAGGLEVGGRKHRIEFVYGDNKSNPSTASSVAISQISQDKVIGIVGGLSSQQAIPMGQMAQAFATPMISPWSTSPVTTLNRPFVFRSAFIFTIQGPAITKFAATEFKAKKAAVLYDIVSAYPRGMAKNFKEAFEAANGAGSVVAFEEFRTGDTDFSKQLARIKDSGADFLFAPQHYNEVPLIVRQAKKMGLTMPIMGSNSWAGGDLIGQCGADCNGLYFTANYAPGNAKGLNKEFVDAYVKAYNRNPDAPAALTWDAMRVMLEAIKKSGGLSGDLVHDRVLVKDSLTAIKGFPGATGTLNFNASGDPDKCVVVVQIEEGGLYSTHDTICP